MKSSREAKGGVVKIVLTIILSLLMATSVYANASYVSTQTVLNEIYNSTDGTIKTQIEPFSSVTAGITIDSVSTGGQPLSSDSTAEKSVIISAPASNTGAVYIGGTTMTTTAGFRITTDSVKIEVDNVQDIYFDAVNAGDSITWLGIQ